MHLCGAEIFPVFEEVQVNGEALRVKRGPDPFTKSGEAGSFFGRTVGFSEREFVALPISADNETGDQSGEYRLFSPQGHEASFSLTIPCVHTTRGPLLLDMA